MRLKPAAPVSAPTPACFDSKHQFIKWREAAVASREPMHAGICTDCTVDYQQKMMRAGRCAHPETVFARDSDGFVQGFNVPMKDAIAAAKRINL